MFWRRRESVVERARGGNRRRTDDDSGHERASRSRDPYALDDGERAGFLAGRLESLGFDLDDGDLLSQAAPSSTPSGMTAEDIRRAFGRSRSERRAAPEVAEAPDESFASTYTTESLYAGPDDAEEPLDPDDPYHVLGVPAGAGWAEIVAAHRTLARQYHPDRHRDSSDEARDDAEETMRRINVAYSALRRAFAH